MKNLLNNYPKERPNIETIGTHLKAWGARDPNFDIFSSIIVGLFGVLLMAALNIAGSSQKFKREKKYAKIQHCKINKIPRKDYRPNQKKNQRISQPKKSR